MIQELCGRGAELVSGFRVGNVADRPPKLYGLGDIVSYNKPKDDWNRTLQMRAGMNLQEVFHS